MFSWFSTPPLSGEGVDSGEQTDDDVDGIEQGGDESCKQGRDIDGYMRNQGEEFGYDPIGTIVYGMLAGLVEGSFLDYTPHEAAWLSFAKLVFLPIMHLLSLNTEGDTIEPAFMMYILIPAGLVGYPIVPVWGAILFLIHYKTPGGLTLYSGSVSSYHRKALAGGIAGKVRKYFISRTEMKEDATDHGVELKNDLNKIHKLAIFNAAKEYGVRDRVRGSGVMCRAYYKLDDMLENFISKMKLHTIADVCAGRGGWTHWLVNRTKAHVHAYSFWNPGHEEWQVPSDLDDRVTKIKGDIHDFKGDKTGFDMVVFDGGESNTNYDKEAEKHAELLSCAMTWVYANPNCEFCLKVLAGTHEKILELCEGVRELTGKGSFVRASSSRNSSTELYFVSWIKNGSKLRSQANQILRDVRGRLRAGVHAFVSDGYVEPKMWGEAIEVSRRQWTPLVHKGIHAPELPEYNMVGAIDQMPGVKNSPRRTTAFLKEMCWYSDEGQSGGGARPNLFVEAVVGRLSGVMRSYSNWSTTDTSAFATFNVVKMKVDKEPLENHPHYPRQEGSMRAIRRYLREHENFVPLRRMTEKEMSTAVNRQGAMGVQDERLGYKNLGEFFDSGAWRERTEEFLDSLRQGKPTRAVYNSNGKLERKLNATNVRKGSRLIWFLPASSRLAELRIFGKFMDILKLMPGSVSGRPIFDYGEMLRQIWLPGSKAVADDVSGWDTKLSKGDLRLECQFLMDLTDDESLKEEIELLYRIYANKVVSISRHYDNADERAIFKVRGQRGSGEFITYALNTVSNLALMLSRTGYAVGVKAKDQEEWALDVLKRTRTENRVVDFLVSGDDSVIVGPEETIRKIANEGGTYMDEVGKPRKEVALGGASEIYGEIEKVGFCSHTYEAVAFWNQSRTEKFIRYMPSRGVEEILAKARLMTKNAADVTTQEAWARAQGFNMVVNYAHIPEVRFTGMVLLGGTRTNISLECMAKPGRATSEPWLSGTTVLDTLNHCLTDKGVTDYPIPWEITSINQVWSASDTRVTDLPTKVRAAWKRGLWRSMLTLRSATKDLAKIKKEHALYDTVFDDFLQRASKGDTGDGIGFAVGRLEEAVTRFAEKMAECHSFEWQPP